LLLAHNHHERKKSWQGWNTQMFVYLYSWSQQEVRHLRLALIRCHWSCWQTALCTKVMGHQASQPAIMLTWTATRNGLRRSQEERCCRLTPQVCQKINNPNIHSGGLKVSSLYQLYSRQPLGDASWPQGLIDWACCSCWSYQPYYPLYQYYFLICMQELMYSDWYDWRDTTLKVGVKCTREERWFFSKNNYFYC